jgi:hypothetical protein
MMGREDVVQRLCSGVEEADRLLQSEFWKYFGLLCWA